MISVESGNERIEPFFAMSAVPKILYQALLQCIDDPFAIIDRDYRYVAVKTNDWVWKSKHTGQVCDESVFNRNARCADCPVAALFEEGNLATVKKLVSLPDGSKKRYQIQAYPVFDRGYNVAYAITVGHDLSNGRIDLGKQYRQIERLQMAWGSSQN